jgi:hypothetical protein
MRGKGKYEGWLTLSAFWVFVILPCAGYGADLIIGNTVTVNGDLRVTGNISEGDSGAFSKTPLEIALLKWYGANQVTTFGVGNSPRGVAFDGANIWVANSVSDTVTKRRTSDGFLLGTYNVGAFPHGVAFDGANIWVTNYNSDNVTKLRASDGAVIGTYSVGAGPEGVAFDGANIWVANSASGTLTKLKASDGSLLGTYSHGTPPLESPLTAPISG